MVALASSQPYPIETVAPTAASMAAKRQRAICTYSITYPGKIRFPEEAGQYIEAVSCRAASYALPATLAACEYNGVVRAVLTQCFESSRLSEAIYREIRRHIPNTEYRDLGIYMFGKRIWIKWSTLIRTEHSMIKGPGDPRNGLRGLPFIRLSDHHAISVSLRFLTFLRMSTPPLSTPRVSTRRCLA